MICLGLKKKTNSVAHACQHLDILMLCCVEVVILWTLENFTQKSICKSIRKCVTGDLGSRSWSFMLASGSSVHPLAWGEAW